MAKLSFKARAKIHEQCMEELLSQASISSPVLAPLFRKVWRSEMKLFRDMLRTLAKQVLASENAQKLVLEVKAGASIHADRLRAEGNR